MPSLTLSHLGFRHLPLLLGSFLILLHVYYVTWNKYFLSAQYNQVMGPLSTSQVGVGEMVPYWPSQYFSLITPRTH